MPALFSTIALSRALTMRRRRSGDNPGVSRIRRKILEREIRNLASRDRKRGGSAAMNRIRDYIGFAVWFAGLGYIALWPLSSPDVGGKPFGASILCRDASLRVLDLLCRSTQPLQLPPGLHAARFAVGLRSSPSRLLLRALKRSRRAAGARAADMSALAIAAAGSGCAAAAKTAAVAPAGQAAHAFRPARHAAADAQ